MFLMEAALAAYNSLYIPEVLDFIEGEMGSSMHSYFPATIHLINIASTSVE